MKKMRIFVSSACTVVAILVIPFLHIIPTTRAQSTKPDFIIRSMAVVPLQPAVGQTVTITITGEYQGVSPRVNMEGLNKVDRGFHDFTYDSLFQPVVPIVSYDQPLDPGETLRYQYVGTFPSFGAKTLSFEIDETNEVDEANESNNKVQTTITVLNPQNLPDLALQSFTVSPQEPTIGQSASLTVRGVYTGSDSLLSTQGVGSFSSAVPDFSGDNGSTFVLNVQPTEAQPLLSGGTFEFTRTGSFASSGQKSLTFTVDAANELYEANENNNTITVTVSAKDAQQSSDGSNTGSETPGTGETQEPEPPGDNSGSGQTPLTDELTALRERIERLNLSISDEERAMIEAEKAQTKVVDATLISRLVGKILLQVEEHGEAWYVDPISRLRYYLKDGATAYQALQVFGLGITTSDLAKIPVGIEDRAVEMDSDDDGLGDKLETALGTDPLKVDTDGDGSTDRAEVTGGTNPLGSGSLVRDVALAARLTGRIVLQVEGQGQAWYIHNGKRYYMKDGELAYQIMRFLSLGITNTDLHRIAVGSFE